MSVDTQSTSDTWTDPAWVEYFRAKDEQCRSIGHRLLAKFQSGAQADGLIDVVSEVSEESGEDIGDVHHAFIVLATRGEVVRRNGIFVAAQDPKSEK